MGVGIYYFYHRFELKAFEGRHIRMPNEQFSAVSWNGGNHTGQNLIPSLQICHSSQNRFEVYAEQMILSISR
jgi:hypothetical protein